jgi:UDP-N-acetylmuramoyl-tripeptide--D-alanyl-D-alanine ligase
MRNSVKRILYILAKLTLARYRPRIVAITGSVGKTSTKEAIALVLKSQFSIRANAGNYNNEFGVPLTIINEESGGKSPVVWLIVFLKALVKLIYTDFPQVLILELGTDHPGDIAYLAGLLGRIEVGVVTWIGVSHLEFFANVNELAREKLSLVKNLDKQASAVLNFDNPKILEGQAQTKAEIMSFGFNENTRVRASDFQLLHVDNQWGVNFKLHYQGTVVPFFLPSALGKPAGYAALAASAVALKFGLNLVQVSQALKFYLPPAGRLRLIKGLEQTLVIDDTYNASPDSTIAALEVLNEVAVGRKIAVLGEMLELGAKNDSGHREVAGKIVEQGIGVVFLVGDNAKIIQDELSKRKFSGRVVWFSDSNQAKQAVKNALLDQDTILVKGSQGIRMERIVKEIMVEPAKAQSLLCRQTEKWINKP